MGQLKNSSESLPHSAFSQPRFATGVLVAFAGLALLLAAVGLHDVLSYIISQRRRELGVRAALGATPLDLVRLVVRQGLALAILGLALGLAGAATLTRLMATVSFAAAPVVLMLVAAAACLVPARRAAAADRAEALRSEGAALSTRSPVELPQCGVCALRPDALRKKGRAEAQEILSNI